MQLPHDLQHFPQPTLLVIADRTRARFWLAGGEALEELDGVALPHELRTDNETSFVNVDTNSSNAPEPKLEDERLRSYGRLVEKHIVERLRKGTAEKFWLIMEARLAHDLIKHLPKDLTDRLAGEVDADLMKADVLDVVRRVIPTTP